MSRGFELQFNWIFVLIAGALILGFFVTVAAKHRSLSNERLELVLSSDVENIFTSAIVSRGTAQNIPSPSQGIGFECSSACDCKFTVGSASKPFGDKSIFAPSFLEGQDLVVWALELKLPYRVTNLLYITNPNIKYYVVKPDNQNALFNQFVKNIPPLIEYENITFADLTSIQHKGHEYVRFVIFNSNVGFNPPSLDDSFDGEEFSSVNVDLNGISFFEGVGTDFNRVGSYVPHIGLPSIYAAMFASDSNMYECSMKTGMRKLYYLSSIYESRSRELDDFVLSEGNIACNYEPLSVAIHNQNIYSSKLKYNLEQSDLSSLIGMKEALENENRRLVQNSCPGVF